MKYRRATNLVLKQPNNKLIDNFIIGDLVTPYYAPHSQFYGVVEDINKVENKVYVNLNGTVRQFDPDEIRVVMKQMLEESLDRKVRFRRATKHVNAIYYCDKPRRYRRTLREHGQGETLCPVCRQNMDEEKFTKSQKIFRCSECGFKIFKNDII